MLKNPETYEIITPELLVKQTYRLVLGKHSGAMHSVDRAIKMGFELWMKN